MVSWGTALQKTSSVGFLWVVFFLINLLKAYSPDNRTGAVAKTSEKREQSLGSVVYQTAKAAVYRQPTYFIQKCPVCDPCLLLESLAILVAFPSIAHTGFFLQKCTMKRGVVLKLRPDSTGDCSAKEINRE